LPLELSAMLFFLKVCFKKRSNMLENSWTNFDARLDRLEAMMLEILQSLLANKSESNDIGGVELAQQITGLSKSTIYRKTSEGTIPHSKQGRLYFSRTDLIRWVKENNKKCND
jgi:excisionase family DNA binding protein